LRARSAPAGTARTAGLAPQFIDSQAAECIRYLALSLVGGVQVGQRSARAVVTHARHQLAKIGASGGGQRVSCMSSSAATLGSAATALPAPRSGLRARSRGRA